MQIYAFYYFENRAPAVGSALRNRWIKSIEDNTKTELKSFYFLACQRHFHPSQIQKKKDRNILDKEAVPEFFDVQQER